MKTHILERIGPKGGEADWKCHRCGLVTRDLSRARESCSGNGQTDLPDIVDVVRRGKAVITWARDPQPCEVCGVERELRPYGPQGENICFACAMSTPEMQSAAERAFGGRLDPERN